MHLIRVVAICTAGARAAWRSADVTTFADTFLDFGKLSHLALSRLAFPHTYVPGDLRLE